MTQIRMYEPYRLVNQLHNEINRLFGSGHEETASATADWTPAVDIREEDDRYVLRADVPGVDPNDIEITMDNGILTISGQRTLESTQDEDGFRRVERLHGRFFRRFTLPDTADAENISASGKHGVLEVIIPKHARSQPRRISVQS